MTQRSVLIVDDEPDILELLEITLSRMNLAVSCAQNFTDATRLIATQTFDFCLTDMRLPDGDGIALVENIQQHRPDMPVAVITAHGNMELAIKAMQAGAYDFVSKPVSLEKLRNLIEKGLETSSIHQVENSSDNNPIIGQSAQIVQLKKTISKFARSQAPVFIQGESGTGKELVARQIHAEGGRRDAPFVAVNCGAIPSELMESEFFGHLKGSFTGAVTDNPGLFKSAQGGTLFLDEIADLPLPMQVKLLRVLQEKSIRPVGSQKELSIDVRIISASHKDLKQMVHDGEFRQDLFYRVNVIDIEVPPLRERNEDIPLISNHILNRLNQQNSQPAHQLTAEAIEALRQYSFPGNIRELENLLERACAMSEQQEIKASDLNLPQQSKPEQSEALGTNSLLDQTAELESSALTQALEANRWNQSAAARELGITLRQLRYRCQKLGLTKSS